jgi:carbon monoxide dehydrogenase subunit G
MTRVTRTFTVTRPVAEVTGYLQDFSHAVDWDPGTVSCQREDTGPVQVGSSWHNVSEFLGRQTELTYKLTRLEPGHLTFVGSNKSATSTDDITVRDTAGTGSEITYQADIELHGLAKLGGPVVKAAMERVADRTVTQLQQTIAGLPG